MIMSKSSSQLADTAFLTSHRQARGFWHLEICSMRASFHGILSLDSRDEIKNIVPFDWPFHAEQPARRTSAQALRWSRRRSGLRPKPWRPLRYLIVAHCYREPKLTLRHRRQLLRTFKAMRDNQSDRADTRTDSFPRQRTPSGNIHGTMVERELQIAPS